MEASRFTQHLDVLPKFMQNYFGGGISVRQKLWRLFDVVLQVKIESFSFDVTE